MNNPNTNIEKQKTAKKVEHIIQQLKMTMPYFRVVKNEDRGREHYVTTLEHVHTHQQFVTNDFSRWAYNQGQYVAFTNPSMLGKILGPYWTRENKPWTIIKNKSEYKDRIYYKYPNDSEGGSGDYISVRELLDFIKTKQTPCITNPMELVEPLTYYLENFEKTNIFKYICTQVLLSFSDYKTEITQNNEEKNVLKFQIAENDNVSEKSTVITIKLVDNKKIEVSGKRNNISLSETYSLRNVGTNLDYVNKIVLKIHITICKKFKMTPFRFVTSYTYLSNLMSTCANNTMVLKISKQNFNRTKINSSNSSTITSATFDLGVFLCENNKTDNKPSKIIKCKVDLRFDIDKLSKYLDGLSDTISNQESSSYRKLNREMFEITIKNNYTNDIVITIYYKEIAIKLLENIKDKLAIDLIKTNNQVETFIHYLGYEKTQKDSWIYKLYEGNNKDSLVGEIYLTKIDKTHFKVSIIYRSEILQKDLEFEVPQLKNAKTNEEVFNAIKDSGIGTAIENLTYWYNH